MKISQNFVAFSEYMNFTIKHIIDLICSDFINFYQKSPNCQKFVLWFCFFSVKNITRVAYISNIFW